jgi:ABC-type Na+ transport system ATPase subunit NatA
MERVDLLNLFQEGLLGDLEEGKTSMVRVVLSLLWQREHKLQIIRMVWVVQEGMVRMGLVVTVQEGQVDIVQMVLEGKCP